MLQERFKCRHTARSVGELRKVIPLVWCATDRWEGVRLWVWGYDIKSDINGEEKTHLWFGDDYKKLKPDHMDDEFGSNIGFTKWKTVWVKDQSVVDTTNTKAGCSTV